MTNAVLLVSKNERFSNFNFKFSKSVVHRAAENTKHVPGTWYLGSRFLNDVVQATYRDKVQQGSTA